MGAHHKLRHESHVCISAPAGVKPDEDVLETLVTDEREEADDDNDVGEDDDDDEVGDDVVFGTSAYKT